MKTVSRDLMVGHKICFYGEIWLIIPKLFVVYLLIWSTVIGNTKTSHSTSTGFNISIMMKINTGQNAKERKCFTYHGA